MDPLFQAGALDDLRAISRSSMTEECQITRQSGVGDASGEVPATDDMGNPVQAPAESVDNDPNAGTSTWCRIGGGPKTQEERLVAGKMEGVDLVVVALPLGTDVREKDSIEVRGMTLEVVYRPNPIPTNAIDLRILAAQEK